MVPRSNVATANREPRTATRDPRPATGDYNELMLGTGAVKARRIRWLAIIICPILLSSSACFGRAKLPPALNDKEYWQLIETLSEPAGTFTLSDNVVSNEPNFANAVRWLRPVGGAYVGVGPEQNFSYIAGLRPAIAFIVDIRRENLDLHLLYKALFDLSTDRPDFVSRLFSRPRPADLTATTSIDQIFESFDRIPPSPDEYLKNAALVRERLLTVHGFPLSPADIEWVERVLQIFYVNGPKVDYYGSRTVDAVRPSYRELMTAKDFIGQPHSFLGSDERFRFVKDLQSRNLIVPVVGDFGGPHALRAVGNYLRNHSSQITAFYGSNVGVYLTAQQTRAFCDSLASIPAWSRARYIDSRGLQLLKVRMRACTPVKK